jgi:hypothetical protein
MSNSCTRSILHFLTDSQKFAGKKGGALLLLRSHGGLKRNYQKRDIHVKI